MVEIEGTALDTLFVFLICDLDIYFIFCIDFHCPTGNVIRDSL
jgi:hypothetical protein